MGNSFFRCYLLQGFDDPSLNSDTWNKLVSKGSTDEIFLTWQWQLAWWEAFGRGKLLLVVAEENNEPIAIAPLYAEEGMIFFVGSGGSDFLDFIGEINTASVLEAMLVFAKDHVPNFVGFRFYHMLQKSRSASMVKTIANRQGWDLFNEGEQSAPKLSIEKFPGNAIEATRKKSLLRHHAWFERSGELYTEVLRTSSHILPFLTSFFDQHVKRWAITEYPSLFNDPKQRFFYKRVTELLSETGWLRFTRIFWNKTNVAFHFGFNYKGSVLWYKPTFDISLAKHSPGEVLLRQLLLSAIEEHAVTFDFGLGDEPFKRRFATEVILVQTWGLYPSPENNKIAYEERVSCQSSS